VQPRHLAPADWDAIAADPEFRALLRMRRRFVIPVTLFFALFYLSLPLGIGLAPAAMSRPVIGPLSAAYALALAQFASAGIVLWLYMRTSKAFDRQAAIISQRVRSGFPT
jgi:uncharacterized membrane protein (DUF485 family)